MLKQFNLRSSGIKEWENRAENRCSLLIWGWEIAGFGIENHEMRLRNIYSSSPFDLAIRPETRCLPTWLDFIKPEGKNHSTLFDIAWSWSMIINLTAQNTIIHTLLNYHHTVSIGFFWERETSFLSCFNYDMIVSSYFNKSCLSNLWEVIWKRTYLLLMGSWSSA